MNSKARDRIASSVLIRIFIAALAVCLGWLFANLIGKVLVAQESLPPDGALRFEQIPVWIQTGRYSIILWSLVVLLTAFLLLLPWLRRTTISAGVKNEKDSHRSSPPRWLLLEVAISNVFATIFCTVKFTIWRHRTLLKRTAAWVVFIFVETFFFMSLYAMIFSLPFFIVFLIVTFIGFSLILDFYSKELTGGEDDLPPPNPYRQ